MKQGQIILIATSILIAAVPTAFAGPVEDVTAGADALASSAEAFAENTTARSTVLAEETKIAATAVADSAVAATGDMAGFAVESSGAMKDAVVAAVQGDSSQLLAATEATVASLRANTEEGAATLSGAVDDGTNAVRASVLTVTLNTAIGGVEVAGDSVATTTSVAATARASAVATADAAIASAQGYQVSVFDAINKALVDIAAIMDGATAALAQAIPIAGSIIEMAEDAGVSSTVRNLGGSVDKIEASLAGAEQTLKTEREAREAQVNAEVAKAEQAVGSVDETAADQLNSGGRTLQSAAQELDARLDDAVEETGKGFGTVTAAVQKLEHVAAGFFRAVGGCSADDAEGCAAAFQAWLAETVPTG